MTTPRWRPEAGTAVILLALAAVGTATNQPVLLAPFAASAVAIAVAPLAPGAAPRAVILAYLLACVFGVVALAPGWGHPEGRRMAAIAATVLTLGAMRLSNAFHLPATAVPILIGATSSTALGAIVPVALGTAVLAALAAIARRLDATSGADRPPAGT